MIGAAGGAAGPAAPEPEQEQAGRRLLVVATGPLVSVQDRGRVGLAHLGVPRSGAADRAALARANRVVGNGPQAAGLEVLLGGLTVRAVGAHLVVAVSGADCPLRLDGRPVPGDAVLDLPPGSELAVGTASAGLRAYLAVRGGLRTAVTLGSRSRDTLSGLGPEPVATGDLLPVGPARPPDVVAWPLLDRVPAERPIAPDELAVLAAMGGPRLDRLDGGSAAALWTAEWTVSATSDRVGVRLEGPALTRDPARAAAELPSEPLVRGAVQVPPDGRPVVFLADHPVTGGYPVVAVVRDADTDRLAQLRPGQRLRLRRWSPVPVRPVRPGSWWGW